MTDPETTPPQRYGPNPPGAVRFPLMRHRWETLTFLHWAYPPEAVQALLPPEFTVETWHGEAWVGLVPFHMKVRPPVGPALPGLTTFPETNVRTYVIGPDGESGVWFFSLDAANPPAVAAARLGYGLPYFMATMDLVEEPGAVTYRSERRLQDGDRVGHEITVVPGDPIPDSELGEFDHFLTARFLLWTRHRGLVMKSPASHPRWPLKQATVTKLSQNLIQKAGLPEPAVEPIVHYSDGVDVRIGRPERVKADR